jgi:hypothetical protein
VTLSEITLPAPSSTSPDEPYERELELLIREARRRQRRRRLVAALLIAAAAAGAYLTTRGIGSAVQSRSLLSRPLHLPSLQPGQPCPTSSGYTVNNSYFAGKALGDGPVRVLLDDTGDVLRGRVDITAGSKQSWHALQTLWFAKPGYRGPFVIRAANLGAGGPIEVQPGSSGLTPGSGPLAVAAGPTINTGDGYRTVPGSTWVTSPGCYGWQIDGRGFSETIIVRVVGR